MEFARHGAPALCARQIIFEHDLARALRAVYAVLHRRLAVDVDVLYADGREVGDGRVDLYAVVIEDGDVGVIARFQRALSFMQNLSAVLPVILCMTLSSGMLPSFARLRKYGKP